jgi:large subunit ribosomal protein L10
LAITREKKEALVARYVEKLRRSQAVLLSEYRGLTVKELEALRRELRGCDSEITVAKNTLIARALAEVGLPAPETLLRGPTAVTFIFGDLAAPTKILSRRAKDTQLLSIRGGILGQAVLDAQGAEALANLPGRDQLRAQVVGALQAPIIGLVSVLAAPLQGLINVLNARAKQLEQTA